MRWCIEKHQGARSRRLLQQALQLQVLRQHWLAPGTRNTSTPQFCRARRVTMRCRTPPRSTMRRGEARVPCFSSEEKLQTHDEWMSVSSSNNRVLTSYTSICIIPSFGCCYVVTWVCDWGTKIELWSIGGSQKNHGKHWSLKSVKNVIEFFFLNLILSILCLVCDTQPFRFNHAA